MVGAATLDARAYEEVEADRGANGQALAVVVLAGVASGVGTRFGLGGLVGGALVGILSWVVWAWLTYLIGTRWLREPDTEANAGQLLRTLGFAASPGVLRVFGVLPILGDIVFVATAVWMLITMVVAVRQALDYRSTGRAVIVCLIGWVLHVVVFATLLRILRAGSV
jgi:hypothetical protein